MRQVYAHKAVLEAGPAPELGANFHIETVRTGGQSQLRILFATEPHRVDAVRAEIDAALSTGPARLVESGCVRIEPADREPARRLLRAG
ncbi:MAG: hypothetical protein ABW046_19440 [Actinoplanes sp.]